MTNSLNARTLPLAILAACMHGASAYWVSPSVGARCFASSRRAAATPLMAVSEASDPTAKEFFDDAKNEEELAWEAEVEALVAAERSAEAIAAAKAMGEAAAAALRDAPPAAGVEKVLESRGKTKPSGKLAKALRKPSGSLALIGEGCKMDGISLGGYDLNEPDYLSGEYRKGGCTAMAVRLLVDGNLGEGALKATTDEQETARGNFPGPLLTIARAPFVDEVQLAAVKADGGAAAMLPLAVNGKEGTATLMEACEAFGLEAIVRVTDATELEAALELEAKMVAIGSCTLSEAQALLALLPKGKAGPVSLADFPFLEVRGAWKVRDLGFNALVSGQSGLDMCARDRVPPSAISKSILSKGSVKYGLGMQKGRLEGSKENLGSISM